MLRTGKEYLESVRDGRRVLCGSEWIDDITIDITKSLTINGKSFSACKGGRN